MSDVLSDKEKVRLIRKILLDDLKMNFLSTDDHRELRKRYLKLVKSNTQY